MTSGGAPEEPPSAKVMFRVEQKDGSVLVETLWATDLEGDRYRIDNCPFYAYSVSFKDIVAAPYDEAQGFPVFEKVLEKSGHRTVRVIFDPPLEEGNKSQAVLDTLIDAGCSAEGANPRYVAIDLPPDVDLHAIRQLLIDADVQWEHADPRYAELFPGED